MFPDLAEELTVMEGDSNRVTGRHCCRVPHDGRTLTVPAHRIATSQHTEWAECFKPSCQSLYPSATHASRVAHPSHDPIAVRGEARSDLDELAAEVECLESQPELVTPSPAHGGACLHAVSQTMC